mgnify:CR=1 FL=1
MKVAKFILCPVLALMACQAVAAQTFSAGTFHSFKGIGVSFLNSVTDPREFNTYTLFADLSDTFSGKEGSAGVKFNFSHNIIIHEFAPADGQEQLSLFIGAGGSGGYVNDYGREGYGLMAALSGSFGLRASFPEKHLSVNFGITVEAGPYLQTGAEGTRFSFYRNGIYQTPYPHVTLSYDFR